jgi:rhodanese-related sulfurtransferase
MGPQEFWTRYTKAFPSSSSSSSPSPPSLQVIDVREKDELQCDGELSHAIHLPLSDSGRWANLLVEGEGDTLSIQSSVPTVVLCAGGVRSDRVAHFLSANCQFNDVYNLSGGVSALSAARLDWRKK